MLHWQDISHDFALTNVLDHVDLRVAPGNVLCLVGPSGCGKSTLLNMAAGLIEPGEGRVENGFCRTACVFQDPRLLPWRRAIDNIGFGLKAMGVSGPERRQAARVLARRMGLESDDIDKYPHELSGGMRQRVSLARALAVKPDLLLLDEPFSALDVGLRRDLQDLVAELIVENTLTAVLVTHDLFEAVRICHEIAVFAPEPGRIVYHRHIARPYQERDDPFVIATAGDLLRIPQVDSAFRIKEGVRA